MPTEIRFKTRPSRTAEMLDMLLAAARQGVIAIAISLTTVLIIQLEITSWRGGEIDQSAQYLQLTITSP